MCRYESHMLTTERDIYIHIYSSFSLRLPFSGQPLLWGFLGPSLLGFFLSFFLELHSFPHLFVSTPCTKKEMIKSHKSFVELTKRVDCMLSIHSIRIKAANDHCLTVNSYRTTNYKYIIRSRFYKNKGQWTTLNTSEFLQYQANAI